METSDAKKRLSQQGNSFDTSIFGPVLLSGASILVVDGVVIPQVEHSTIGNSPPELPTLFVALFFACSASTEVVNFAQYTFTF